MSEPDNEFWHNGRIGMKKPESQPQQDAPWDKTRGLPWTTETRIKTLENLNAGQADIIRDLRAALAQAREALVDAQEELRLIREKDCNAVYNPLLRTVTIPLALESSRAALATQPGKATGPASPSEPEPNPK